MIIEVDCNNDVVHLQGRGFKVTDNVNFKIKDPITILKMLEEIFTEVTNNVDEGLDVTLDVTLVKIDEDTRTIVGEW